MTAMETPPYIMTSPPNAKAVINNRDVDYFCGTSYYALHARQSIYDAAYNAIKNYGIGSATSISGFGNNPVLLDVEHKAAQFFGTERALYFVSGYLGNSVLLQGLSPEYDIIFVDEQSHYSVMDGIAIARKPAIHFSHCDPDDLAEKSH